MRCMLLVIPKDYEAAKPGTMPDPKMVEEMMKYNKALKDAGILLELNGLHPPSMGTRVFFEMGKSWVEEGPFQEAPETLGGYWILKVRSKEEAVEWAQKAPMAEGDVIEIRRIQEVEEFSPEVREVAHF